jgi:rhamnose transport system ATP-binding protein
VTKLLELSGISKTFGGVQALDGVSFDLRAGEVHALVGENGAGKSTLIKVITGAHLPDQGTITVQGQPVGELDPVRARNLGIAAIYQQPALFPDLTVAENIAIGLETAGAWRRVRWSRRRTQASQLLEKIGSTIDPDTPVHTLSMPEQQLVEIARALGADACIVIMDEPTASLADQEVDRLFRVIGELKSHGVGIIFISHRLEELPQIADRVTALRDGVLIGTRAMAEVSRGDLIRMMVGRELSAVFPKTFVEPGDTVLEVRDVGNRASGVHHVSLSVRAGEILGLAGLVGAGRTELARVLFGLTPADTGEVWLRGQLVHINSPTRAAALGIAYVPEDRRRHGVVLDMSTAANTTLATLAAVSRFGFLDFDKERAVAQGFVRQLSIKTPSLTTPVGNLSGGNQQKVALARWLAANPALLILDEPTQGVDVGAKAEIHRLMSELAGRGLAILMISSELPEILGMSDRIAVMHGGTIVSIVDRACASQEAILELALGHVPTHPPGGPGRIADARADSAGIAPTVLLPLVHSHDHRAGFRRGLRIDRYRRELSVAAAYAALLLLLAVAAPRFFLADSLRAIIVSNAPVLVAAIGMTMVILCRQIDISIGSIFSICGVVAGLLAEQGFSITWVLLGTLAAGSAIGAINGLLVARLGLPSIVVTLATLVIGRESLRYVREGAFVRNLPPGFQWFGAGQAAGQWLVVAIAIAVFGFFAFALQWLAAGRAVYATGSDPEAARLAGIRPRLVVFGVFVAMGALTGLAALLNAVRFSQVDPNAGLGLELQVIAAVVVGGVAVSGGRGTLVGSLIGVALLGSIGPALVFLGASLPAALQWFGKPQWEKAIQGMIILLAVSSDAFGRKPRG